MKTTILLILLVVVVILAISIFVDRIVKNFMKKAGLNIKDDKITNKPKGEGNADDKNIINDVANRYGIKRRKPKRKGS